MLEPVLGSLVREQVLLFIHAHGEGYAREISRYFEASLDSVQKQLKRLENGSVLKCERKGRTVIYSFNKKYLFLSELRRLLDRVGSCYSSDIKIKNTEKRYLKRYREKKKRASVSVREYGES